MDDAEKLDLARVIHATEHRLHRYCVSRFASEAGSDCSAPALTFPQVNMLMTVRERGSMTIKQLAQVLHVKAPAVSAMVERLVEQGILTRSENPVDRREVLVELSASHNEWVDELERKKLQIFVELVEKVGEDSALMWRALGMRIQEVLREESREDSESN